MAVNAVDSSRLLSVTAGGDDFDENLHPVEQAVAAGAGDDHRDGEEQADSSCPPLFSEWRIPVRGLLTLPPKETFQSSDFRDPRTGESVMNPPGPYYALVHEIAKHQTAASYKFMGVLLILYVAVMMVPMTLTLMIPSSSSEDEDEEGASAASSFSWLPLVVFFGMAFVAYEIGRAVLVRIYRTLDSQIQTMVVDPRRKEFLESYGVEMGYSSHHDSKTNSSSTRFWNEKSHVWLHRPRQEQEQATASLQEEYATTKNSTGCPLPYEEFPPIYLLYSVPGDIHIHEREYHQPSMSMDLATWTLIQKTHVEVATMSRTLRISLFLLILPLLPWIMFFSILLTQFGFWKPVISLMLYVGVLYLIGWWLQRRSLEKCQQVAERVTRILQNDEETQDTVARDNDGDYAYDGGKAIIEEHRYGYTYNEPMAAYSLELKTSPLPGRPVELSGRYQLVRKERGTTTDNESDNNKSNTSNGTVVADGTTLDVSRLSIV